LKGKQHKRPQIGLAEVPEADKVNLVRNEQAVVVGAESFRVDPLDVGAPQRQAVIAATSADVSADDLEGLAYPDGTSQDACRREFWLPRERHARSREDAA
jgi:hypothetical protein